MHRDTEHKDLKPGTLLRVVEHCRKNKAVKQHGEYAVLAPKQVRCGQSFLWDAVFPSGHRVLFVAANWEVVSHAR